MDTPYNIDLKLQDILLDSKLAKFGDSIVNFIYNAAIYRATQKLKGIKVWDQCLAKACKNSPLKLFVASRKNAGELGDAVEAFVCYIYLKNNSKLEEMIKIMSKIISQNKHLLDTKEKELCTDAFTYLLNVLSQELNIST